MREPPQRLPRDAPAEPGRGRLLEPVRFVEDDGVVLGQHAAARGDVREVQRVVDDHEIGLRGAGTRRLREARGNERAAAARAAVGADRELAPERGGRLDLELGAVARLGRVEPRLHRLPRRAVVPARKQERLEALQLPPAEVVRAALEDARVDGPADRGCRDRHVLAEQLFLERLRRRRDDDALARLERRDQVREALADAGSRLGDEVLAEGERALDRSGKRRLLGARLVLGQRVLERAAGAEDVDLRPQRTRSNGCSP